MSLWIRWVVLLIWPGFTKAQSLLLLHSCVLKPTLITHTSAWNHKRRSQDRSGISTERSSNHKQREFLERTPDSGDFHGGRKTQLGLPSQQPVAVCKAGPWHSTAHCAMWATSWRVGIPCQHPLFPWTSKALCLLWARWAPRPANLTWSLSLAWFSQGWHKGWSDSKW